MNTEINLAVNSVPQTLTLFHIWWDVLRGFSSLGKTVIAQQSYIHELECQIAADKTATQKMVKKLEAAVIAHGDVKASPKTLRHIMLKIIDDHYYSQKVAE